MNFPFLVARRYLLSKKKTNIINILSLLSLIGVALSTAALVIILSVFNGFEQQIYKSYNSISPDIRITASQGKRFENDSALFDKIKKTDGVKAVIPTIEERAVLQFNGKTAIVTLLGFPDDGKTLYDFSKLMSFGDFYTSHDGQDFIILGYPLALKLKANLFALDPITVYAAKRGRHSTARLSQAFKTALIRPSGIYDIDDLFASEYAIVSFAFARKLFSMENQITAWDIKTDGETAKVQRRIKRLLGENFTVKNRYELNDTLFKMLKLEKFFVFATLSIILLIAAFNIVGSLSMIIIDKKEDIAVLKSMGAETRLVKRIFVLESLMISLFGALVGLAIGLIICAVQWKFGLVMMHGSYGSIPFPVAINWQDMFWVILVVLIIVVLIARLTVRSIPKEMQVVNKY